MGSDGPDDEGGIIGGIASSNTEQMANGVNTSDERRTSTLTTEGPVSGAQGSGDVQGSSSSSPENNTSSSSESSRSDREPGDRKRGKGKKLDRSKLRKGKWTVEEEEYTSRIIHYFSTGLLTLPEGATLRSYLAEKLNCDPMRITKKYAGASCLGRRVYQFRERIHPTMADIQVARTELDHLEQRFRMRVEGDAGGQPVQRSSHTSQSLVQPSAQPLLPTPIPSQNPIQNLLLGLLGAQAAAAPSSLQIPAFATSGTPLQPTAQAPTPSAALMGSSSATGQSIGASAPAPSVATIAPIQPNHQPSAQLVFPQGALDLSAGAANPAQGSAPGVIDPNLANWVLLQAAASLGPALTQLAAAQQQQQQPQQIQIQPQPQQLTHQHLAQHQLAHQQLAQHQLTHQQLTQHQVVQKQQPQPVQQQQPQPVQQQKSMSPVLIQPQALNPQACAPTPSPAPGGDQVNQMQAQQRQLQAQIQEQQAKLQQQLMQLNAAAAAAAGSAPAPQSTQHPTFPVAQPAGQNPARVPHSHPPMLLNNPTPPTMGSIRMDTVPQVAPATTTQQHQQPGGQNAAEHFTKDLKQAYDLHLKSQRDHGAVPSSTVEAAPTPAVGFSTLSGLGIPTGIVGNVPTLPQQQNHLPATRTEEDRAAGTALLGFLSSLRQSYENALRDQHGSAAGVTVNRADSPSFPNKSDSSDENRAATVTDSNAGSNQPDSSVEDSDWNSDKKADPSSSEESDDKETPGKTSKERASKRQKLATHDV